MSGPASIEKLPSSVGEQKCERTEENLTSLGPCGHRDCHEAGCCDPQQGYLSGPRCVRCS
jgi:hypothetical protein